MKVHVQIDLMDDCDPEKNRGKVAYRSIRRRVQRVLQAGKQVHSVDATITFS